MSICREVGGAWEDGEPCGMDARPDQRCDFHAPSVEAALAAALRAGVLDVTTGRVRLDYGQDRGTRAAVDRLIEIGVLFRGDEPWATIDAQDEQHRLRGLIAAYSAAMFVLWDLVTAPGTDASLRLAESLRHRLAALSDALGVRLADACRWATLEVYRDMPGKRWPLQRQRHAEDCDQPRDAQGRTTCDCPVQFDWEYEEPVP